MRGQEQPRQGGLETTRGDWLILSVRQLQLMTRSKGDPKTGVWNGEET